MNAFINTQDFARMGMATVLVGAALNIALDPLFIFVLGLGVKGAAWATVISQGVSGVWVMAFLLGKSPSCAYAGNICCQRPEPWGRS